MNDTHQDPPAGDTGRDADPPAEGFDAQRLRTVADMQRSSTPRLVAGVCAGIARYLNVDPVLVRIVFAVLIFLGGAGVILYAAFWFLVPADDAEKSIAADWFRLDANEERIRVGGLVVAAALAVLVAVGDSG
ncbi:MAG: PspC domain-containing protein, partial [Aeromicrobium sp.]